MSITISLHGQKIAVPFVVLQKIPHFDSILQRWNNSNVITVDICDMKIFKTFIEHGNVPEFYVIPYDQLASIKKLCDYFCCDHKRIDFLLMSSKRIVVDKTIEQLMNPDLHTIFPYHKIVSVNLRQEITIICHEICNKKVEVMDIVIVIIFCFHCLIWHVTYKPVMIKLCCVLIVIQR